MRARSLGRPALTYCKSQGRAPQTPVVQGIAPIQGVGSRGTIVWNPRGPATVSPPTISVGMRVGSSIQLFGGWYGGMGGFWGCWGIRVAIGGKIWEKIRGLVPVRCCGRQGRGWGPSRRDGPACVIRGNSWAYKTNVFLVDRFVSLDRPHPCLWVREAGSWLPPPVTSLDALDALCQMP